MILVDVAADSNTHLRARARLKFPHDGNVAASVLLATKREESVDKEIEAAAKAHGPLHYGSWRGGALGRHVDLRVKAASADWHFARGNDLGVGQLARLAIDVASVKNHLLLTNFVTDEAAKALCAATLALEGKYRRLLFIGEDHGEHLLATDIRRGLRRQAVVHLGQKRLVWAAAGALQTLGFFLHNKKWGVQAVLADLNLAVAVGNHVLVTDAATGCGLHRKVSLYDSKLVNGRELINCKLIHGNHARLLRDNTHDGRVVVGSLMDTKDGAMQESSSVALCVANNK